MSNQVLVLPVFIVGVHRYSFRTGEKAEIIGVFDVCPGKDFDFRLCYKLKYEDGFEDFLPLSEVENGSYAIYKEY